MEEMAASVHSGGLSSGTWQEQSSNPVCQCQWKMVVRQVRGRPCGNIKRSRLHPHLGHSEAVYGLCGAHRSASFSSQSLSPSHTDLNLTIFRPSPPKMFSLLLTGLLATTVALASDDSSGATKTVLVSAPGLLRPPVLQGSRFVVSSGGQRPTVVDTPTVVLTAYQQQQQQQQQEQSSPVRAATTGSSSEGKAVPAYQSEVPQQEQSAGLSAQAFYSSSYPQHYDYSHRRYVPSSYVYSPPYLYPSSGGAVQHPFLQGQQSPVIELDALSAPVQILVRTPTGLQVFRPVPLSRPPVHYFVGVFSTEQQQGSKQPPAAQEQSLLTKVEVPVSSEVANETQSSGDTSPAAAAAAASLASSATVTEVAPSGGQSTGEAKAESSGTSDSF